MSIDLSPDLLAQITIETLEDAAFIFAEPYDDAPNWTGEVLEARLPFSGAEQGVLSIAVGTTFARELAANLMGIEPSDQEAEAKGADALGELLNIACGVFLEKWRGESTGCRMGVPSLNRLDANEHERNLAACNCKVALLSEDDARFDVAVFEA